MANLAAAEAALRARKLDRTLTTARPVLEPSVAPTEVKALDAGLLGGLPRGQVSEIAGPRSSGRTTLLLQLLAAATARDEIAAVVDTFDCLDVASAASAGVELERLLWIRGHSMPPALFDRAIERALKALNLILQAGGFGVVAIDFSDAPLAALNRIPFTTWLRIQRTIEGTETACLLVAPHPLARSAGGVTLSVTGCPQWDGTADRSRRLTGLEVALRVVSPRRRMSADVTIAAVSADGPCRPGPLGPGCLGGSERTRPTS
jgi:RecA DNA recombination protein